jgi:hypothetical protein
LKASFSDLSARPDAPIINLEDIVVVLNNVDGKSAMKFDVGVKVREGGQIKAVGTANPATPSVESDIQVADFSLTPFQPYLDQFVALTLKSGAVSTRGKLLWPEEAGSDRLPRRVQGGQHAACRTGRHRDLPGVEDSAGRPDEAAARTQPP